MAKKIETRPQRHIQKVRVDAVIRDEANQVRRAIDEALVRRYATQMELGTEFPPILVAREHESLTLVDGWHRLAAHDALGWPEAWAEVVPVEDPREVRWLAAEANLKHGKQLTGPERRNVFRAYVRARKHRTTGNGFRTYPQIAMAVGAAVGSVHKWMRADFPRTARAMGGHCNGGGGAWDNEPDDELDDRRHVHRTRRLMDQSLASFRAVSSQEHRETIVRDVQSALMAMRGGGGSWEENHREWLALQALPAQDFL